MNRQDAQILVADDSPSMRVCLSYLLRQLGFKNIDEAPHGATALAMFRRKAYDVVITDWYMPHLSGLSLLRAIRRGPKRQSTPVLVLTGTVTNGSLHEAVAAGATGFVPKPFFNPSLSDQVIALIDAIPDREEEDVFTVEALAS